MTDSFKSNVNEVHIVVVVEKDNVQNWTAKGVLKAPKLYTGEYGNGWEERGTYINAGHKIYKFESLIHVITIHNT